MLNAHFLPCSETLMGIIKATLPDQVLISFYTTLNEDGFWEGLGLKIYGPGTALACFLCQGGDVLLEEG